MKNHLFLGRIFLIIFFFVTLLNYANANVLTAKELSAEIIITGGIDVVPQSAEAQISSLRADLYLFPRTLPQQTAGVFHTMPLAEISDKIVQYHWSNPSEHITYELSTTVNTNDAIRVKKKDLYPVQGIPPETMQFLQESKIITSTDSKIRAQANKLATGTDDLFIVVTRIADWTKQNVVYNLTSLTAEVTQPASWVLEHKQGVCDELTSLFIAMLRSIGIPARFVSGLSYSASPLVPNNWGSHGWAEVWFPHTGWVQFDPTFGQYGWVDAGHITLKQDADPSERSVQFVWEARDEQIQAQPLHMSGTIQNEGKPRPPELKLHIEQLHNRIGFGSANVIHARATNLQDYYVATRLRLATAPELNVELPEQLLILQPHSEKMVSWLVRTTTNLQHGFSYSMPLLVFSDLNETAHATLIVEEHLPVYTSDDVLPELETELQGNVLSCTVSAHTISPQETSTVSCLIPKTYTELCLNKNCKQGEREITFTIQYTKPGFFPQHLNTPDNEYGFTTVIEMQDKPQIALTQIVAPAQIGFDDAATITWSVEQTSFAQAKNIIVTHKHREKNISWPLEQFEPQEFSVHLAGRTLEKENEFVLRVTWQDTAGKTYSSEKKIFLTVHGNWWQSIVLWMNGIMATLG